MESISLPLKRCPTRAIAYGQEVLGDAAKQTVAYALGGKEGYWLA
jgi:hypothetical protein